MAVLSLPLLAPDHIGELHGGEHKAGSAGGGAQCPCAATASPLSLHSVPRMRSARAVPTYAQIPPGCTPRPQWGSPRAFAHVLTLTTPRTSP
jgi:hypothetical protein